VTWTIRLSAAAEQDYRQIIGWTLETFGDRQALVYSETLIAAMDALRDGPEVSGSKARDDIGPGIRLMHVARGGRKGRHLVMYRVAEGEPDSIAVLRLLHDAMDPPRHWPRSES
jgi:toxin ParE1/3/4